MVLCCVGIYCGYRTVDIAQCYSVVLEFILVTGTLDKMQWYCVVLEFIVVTATVDIVQWYCVVFGD